MRGVACPNGRLWLQMRLYDPCSQGRLDRQYGCSGRRWRHGEVCPAQDPAGGPPVPQGIQQRSGSVCLHCCAARGDAAGPSAVRRASDCHRCAFLGVISAVAWSCCAQPSWLSTGHELQPASMKLRSAIVYGQVPARLLMGPGPANAHPRVLAAQTLPLLGECVALGHDSCGHNCAIGGFHGSKMLLQDRRAVHLHGSSAVCVNLFCLRHRPHAPSVLQDHGRDPDGLALFVSDQQQVHPPRQRHRPCRCVARLSHP